ncbi:hypothetical protein CMQ_4683 [Grosmannia clavigera kw1407]|uniref:Uncharacterized protein n=1 Tax=Grosmannia clavigera (strain kw1407 / UAMH 11150) TaxID=655863 RepID=F0XU50_GROCL|nr:uncharacterized protein CMQ_4683 [Grosmannia clavigera kw1407]EFW98831.1 hypothetical protein CMQ_4683 [Grosmannia clavigera kw1407]
MACAWHDRPPPSAALPATAGATARPQAAERSMQETGKRASKETSAVRELNGASRSSGQQLGMQTGKVSECLLLIAPFHRHTSILSYVGLRPSQLLAGLVGGGVPCRIEHID